MSRCLSVPDLVSAGIVLRPAEAVAIVSEVCRQCLEGRAHGIPPPSAIRVIADGTVEIRGPAISGDSAVVRAAHLLNALLPPFDAPPEYRAPGGLRLVIARALGTLDLPPYESLREFKDALARFGVPEPRDEVRGLFCDWERAQAVSLPATTTGAIASAARAGGRGRGIRYAATVAIPVSAAALLTLLEVNAPSGITTASSPRATQAIAARRAPAETPRSSPRIVQAAAFSPTFAHGGRTVYFHQLRGEASTLHRADTDLHGKVTGVTSVVSDRARNFHPRPSPDASRIAFDSDREGTRAVYVARADGSAARRISGAGFAAVPTWSPDGTQLAFVKAEPRAPAVWNLWVAAADGSNLKRLTDHRVGQPWGGSWFPDGRAIAYSVETRLVVLDLVTGARRTFDSPRRGRLARTPAVAPDGRRIIFQVRRDGAWVLDVDSGRMRRVLSDPTAEEFTWSPDGQRVAFHSYRTGEWSVWVMAP